MNGVMMLSMLSPETGLLATSTVELTIRMGVALAVIMAIMYLATRFAKRQIGFRGQDRPQIEVRAQRQLTKHATLSLVRAGGRQMLIASNSQAITLLAEGDDLTKEPAGSDHSERSGSTNGPRFRRSRGLGDAPSISDGSIAAAADDGSPGADRTSIDIRPMPRGNPIRALQNRTVRRS